MTLDDVSTGDPHVPAHNAERAAINALQNLLDSKITLPSGLATGDLLRWDGTQIVSTETRFFEGNGTPNGVVAAPVGSRYVDKLATKGAVEWVKVTDGDSNTGWTTHLRSFDAIGQAGTVTITGGAAKIKSKVVPLNPAIFLGTAPRQILLSPYGSYSDLSHPYVSTKSATSFTAAVRNIDNVNYTAAATIAVDFLALI